jgi:hypothetical protein
LRIHRYFDDLVEVLKLVFFQDMQRNSVGIKEDCDSLCQDVTLLGARLSNVTNKFLMISNAQFVENRVQEFEEKDGVVGATGSQQGSNASTTVERIMTKQEKETELIGKMKEAIQLGISACEQRSSSL